MEESHLYVKRKGEKDKKKTYSLPPLFVSLTHTPVHTRTHTALSFPDHPLVSIVIVTTTCCV